MSSNEPDTVPRGAIACLSLAACASAMSLRVNDAMLPMLAAQFDVPLGAAAQVIGIFATAYGLAQWLFGPLGDRFGKYRVVAWASGACALTSLACALAPAFDALRIARGFAGATAAAVIPLSMAFIGDVIPYERRQPVLARFLTGQIIGLSAGVLLGGFAADHLSWRAPYVVLAAGFAAVCVALFRFQRRLPVDPIPADSTKTSPVRRIVVEFGEVLAVPWARIVLAIVFLEGMTLFGAFAFIASHLHEGFALSLSASGATVMLYGLGGLVFAFTAGRLVSRLGERGLARWGGIVLFTALLAIAWGPHWSWALIGCFAAGLGFYMLHNTLQVNATQMAPQRRGAAVSAFASSFFIGQSVGVYAAGRLVQVIGTSNVLVAGATGVLVVSFLFVAMHTRHRR